MFLPANIRNHKTDIIRLKMFLPANIRTHKTDTGIIGPTILLEVLEPIKTYITGPTIFLLWSNY